MHNHQMNATACSAPHRVIFAPNRVLSLIKAKANECRWWEGRILHTSTFPPEPYIFRLSLLSREDLYDAIMSTRRKNHLFQ